MHDHMPYQVEAEPTESPEARIERLGRQRPENFPSLWAEIGFCYAVVMSQVLSVGNLKLFVYQVPALMYYQEYFVSGFNVVLPTVASNLNIPTAQSTWPANAFSLVVASFLLPSGRIAGMKTTYYEWSTSLIGS